MSTAGELTVEHHRDYTGAKIGMWLFLFTELLLFGGLFLLYSVYRSSHPDDFHHGAMELNTLIGTLNTVILLTSSLTMVISIAAIHRANKKLALICLGLTIAFALWFLVNKYFEWGAKFEHGIYPNSEVLLQRGDGEVLFFGLYFSMTGLHGLHVLIGAIVLLVAGVKLIKKPFDTVDFDPMNEPALQGAKLAVVDREGRALWNGGEIDDTVQAINVRIRYRTVPRRARKEDYALLENAGLYWHLVDVIWIFLFPLFYLIT